MKKGGLIDTLYVDMDGVIVDFEMGVHEIVNEFTGSRRNEISKEILKDLVAFDRNLEEHGVKAVSRLFQHRPYKEAVRTAISLSPDWWENLPWMKDGKELWNHLKQYNPVILSSPMRMTNASEGKVKWCERELGSEYEVIVVDDKDEYATPGTLLLDDNPDYIAAFLDAGGHVIHHSDAKSSIPKVDKFMGFHAHRNIKGYDSFK